jgi:hypothetical protein
MSLLLSILTGSLGVTIAAGAFELLKLKVEHREKRKETQADETSAEKKALRYIMLYIIEERCKEHISNGTISVEELRQLHLWHDVYHNGLGGNGDADKLMSKVEALKLETN